MEACIPSPLSLEEGSARWPLIATAVALALAGTILFGVLVKVRTEHGTIVAEVVNPDPNVGIEVLDEQGKLLVEDKAGKEQVEIGAAPGKRTLRVMKGGMEILAKDFTLTSGGREAVKVHLEPVPAVGTLVVQVSDPEALVEVLDGRGKTLAARKAGTKKIELPLAPGKGTVRVTKPGMEAFVQQFALADGGRAPVVALLKPVPPTPPPPPVPLPPPAPGPSLLPPVVIGEWFPITSPDMRGWGVLRDGRATCPKNGIVRLDGRTVAYCRIEAKDLCIRARVTPDSGWLAALATARGG